MLAHHRRARVAEQFVVVEQAAGDGVLDGGHADDGGVAADFVVDLLEGGAADDLHLFSLEIQVGGDVVKRTDAPLDGDSPHIIIMCIIKIVVVATSASLVIGKKKPAS